MEKVSLEVAKAEVEKWIAAKKISAAKVKESKTSLDVITSAVQDGDLVLNENMSFTQYLKFPYGEGNTIISFDYLPRVPVDAVHLKLKTLDPSDGDGRLAAYVATLAKSSIAIVRGMDTEDWRLAQAIAIFFL